MSEGERPARVGIRELRQNLSIYVERVKDGETLEVTEHGRPVAELGPLRRQPKSLVDQRLTDGRITAAKQPFELPNLVEPPEGVDSVSATLQTVRDGEWH